MTGQPPPPKCREGESGVTKDGRPCSGGPFRYDPLKARIEFCQRNPDACEPPVKRPGDGAHPQPNTRTVWELIFPTHKLGNRVGPPEAYLSKPECEKALSQAIATNPWERPVCREATVEVMPKDAHIAWLLAYHRGNFSNLGGVYATKAECEAALKRQDPKGLFAAPPSPNGVYAVCDATMISPSQPGYWPVPGQERKEQARSAVTASGSAFGLMDLGTDPHKGPTRLIKRYSTEQECEAALQREIAKTGIVDQFACF